MTRLYFLIKVSVALVLLSSLNQITISQAEEDLELCPSGFDQGVVTTGAVECEDQSTRRSQREDAETDRVELEAICSATANAAVTRSDIFGTSSGGFFARVTCTISRPVPSGTVLCPADSDEVYRAFDKVICQYFGSAFATASPAQAALALQITDCVTTNGGSAIQSMVGEGMVDDITFFSPRTACALTTRVVDNIECPFSFNRTSQDEDSIECIVNDRSFASIGEAQAANQASQAICTDTTAGLGTVTEFLVGATSNSEFFSVVECLVAIPRFSDFTDQEVLRACDATCTEQIQQARTCLNGGEIGGPGCLGSASQEIEKRCNTGPDQSGLCPLALAPSTVIAPLLLLDEDGEE